MHPDGQVRIHTDEPSPIIRVRPDTSSGFRRYGFVNAVLGLDPAGRLGLLSSDYQVQSNLYLLCCWHSLALGNMAKLGLMMPVDVALRVHRSDEYISSVWRIKMGVVDSAHLNLQ